MDDWLKRVAAAVGSDEQLSGEDADALLKIARIAAHESDDRRNAPLLCYLIGRMQTDRPLVGDPRCGQGGLRSIELVSHSAFAHLHPTGSTPSRSSA